MPNAGSIIGIDLVPVVAPRGDHTERTIPNQGILIDTLALQEAKAFSEIENIVTTQERPGARSGVTAQPPAAKEVALYRDALRLGYARLTETGGLIPNSTLIDMFRLLKGREDGFRTTPGTALRHDRTGEIVYVPPQDAREVLAHMTALERFINDDALSDLDPLIKMAVIHHQFESIHPFADGNGRIGRILNVLYLRGGPLALCPTGPAQQRHAPHPYADELGPT